MKIHAEPCIPRVHYKYHEGIRCLISEP